MKAVLEHRSRRAAYLKASATKTGQFEAIVAVFGNVDSFGDRIIPGAFVDSLSERGFPAIVWSHMWDVVPIGAAAEAEEVSSFKLPNGDTIDGLRILGDLLVDDHEVARQAWAAMKAQGGDGRSPLREFSFAFFTVRQLTADEEEFEPIEPGHIRDLLKLDVIEVGPTLLGANPATQLIAAANALNARGVLPTSGPGSKVADVLPLLVELREGRVLSQTNYDKLLGARDEITAVIAAADKTKNDGKSTVSEERERAALELMLPVLPAV